MKKLIFFLSASLLLCSCKQQEKILMQKNLMSNVGQVRYIDKERGFFSVRWECADPPFKNQPCYKFMEFPIYLFGDVQLGDTIKVLK